MMVSVRDFLCPVRADFSTLSSVKLHIPAHPDRVTSNHIGSCDCTWRASPLALGCCACKVQWLLQSSPWENSASAFPAVETMSPGEERGHPCSSLAGVLLCKATVRAQERPSCQVAGYLTFHLQEVFSMLR